MVLTEAPSALKQHLSMHIGTLTTYRSVREVVVSYLQAKRRVWTPSAAYAGATARRDPDAMNIGMVGDKGKNKPRGKGKDAKGKDKNKVGG